MAATEGAPSLKDTFPAMRDAQSAYLGQIDSLPAPDRRTHELIRLACSVILRHPNGIRRHAMLAAEFGASWEDVVGTLVLTQPGFGFVPALEALAVAREGYEEGAGPPGDAEEGAGPPGDAEEGAGPPGDAEEGAGPPGDAEEGAGDADHRAIDEMDTELP